MNPKFLMEASKYLSQKPNTMFPERLPWNNLSQNWKRFFPTTTKIGQHQRVKNLYKQRSKCSITFHLFEPLTITLFSGIKMWCLRVITISHVWVVLYKLLSVFTSMIGVVETYIPLLVAVYLSKFFFSLFLSFSIFEMGINQPLSHRINERVKSIICKGLKIVLLYDKYFTHLGYTRRRSYSIWSSQSPCEVGWARMIMDTLFLRKWRPRENKQLVVNGFCIKQI